MENVSFSYDGRLVLENASFEVQDQELVCVVGPNGGGKTTLIKIMLGLEHPRHGRVRIFNAPPGETRGRIGYMPQHLQYDPLFPVTVLDIVLMGRLGTSGFRLRFSAKDREAAREALSEMDLADRAQSLFADLSGGQRQRVLIARAISCNPKLLLLDEPTANVDPKAEALLVDTIRALNKRMTVIMVSHDLGFVSDIVERVICVNKTVHIHPTSDVTGQVIRDVYGMDRRMVRHDHHSEKDLLDDGLR
ncbi:ABC transporter ATP-binding protein [bacterium]|nr:ABC transporter ATP-binding protein [bacterium]